MNISEALIEMQKGEKITKSNWGKNTYIRLFNPYSDSKFAIIETEPIDGTLMPSIYMKTEGNTFIPWSVSQSHLFCSDFQIFELNSLSKNEEITNTERGRFINP